MVLDLLWHVVRSMELRPNAIICAFYTNGVGGVAEQCRLQNPTGFEGFRQIEEIGKILCWL